ncbi:MAG: efflux RND transporter periplasmic adaptor subunit [Pseudomonadota bacterium]
MAASVFPRAGLVALVFALCSGCERDPTPPASAGPATHQLPTTVVASEQLPVRYTTTGTVVSDERVEISSRIAAYLRTLEVREGERVARGQRIATLDSQDVTGAIRQAAANRDKAAAALRDARKDLQDAEELFRKGVVSASALRKARLEHDVAAQELEAARAALLAARAELRYTEILSPVAGVVVERPARSGDLVTPGSAIVTVESDTALLFETFVAESRLAHIRLGDPVEVHIDATGSSHAGEVLRLVSSGDPVTRRYLVKISLADTRGLVPGMFGRSLFTVGERPGLLVPNGALTERGGLTGVFAVTEGGVLRFRWVRTGNVLGERTEITAGLEPGTTLLARVTAAVSDGDLLADAP